MKKNDKDIKWSNKLLGSLPIPIKLSPEENKKKRVRI
jgi:hypothetical protein